MSLINAKINSDQEIELLKELLEKGNAPFVLSTVFKDGHIGRKICQDRRDMEMFLLEAQISDIKSYKGKDFLLNLKRLARINVIVYEEETCSPVELIIEQIIPVTSIVVFGAGHVGKAVAEISVLMGWNVIVIDDRQEFLDRIGEAQSGISKINESFESVLPGFPVSRTSALVIVTRGHQHDAICLEAGLKTDAFYIGMIGSRRRVASIFKELEGKGVSMERLSEVYAPIGLNINATTPQEIAIAIIGEIIGVQNSSKRLEK